MNLKSIYYLLSLLLLLTGSGMAHAQNVMPRELAFYAVPQANCAPDSNERLPDACWEKAAAATTYYEYWNANPGLSTLKSDLKLLYDTRGIYVKIVNHDDNIKNLRASIIRRDDPQLWTDDCAELYFDPRANGMSYTAFVMNSSGFQSDRMQQDLAVSKGDWNGYEWRVTTHQNEKSWTIEAFFPWVDLGSTAKAGDVWMFNHVRFAWSSGKFVGSTWAPGGSYQSPGKFGFLYFEGNEKISPEAVAKVLGAAVPAPWMLPTINGILIHPTPDKMELIGVNELAATRRAELQQALQSAKEITQNDTEAQKKLAEIETRAQAISYQDAAQAVDAVKKMAALQSEANAIYWPQKMKTLIEDATR